MARAPETRGRNIVLVGVAGVGKTTLGALAAERLGLPFIDVDVEHERETGSDVDTLLDQYGDEGYNQRLLEYCIRQFEKRERAVIAVPPRLMNYRRFWLGCDRSRFLRGFESRSLRVFCRVCAWAGGPWGSAPDPGIF